MLARTQNSSHFSYQLI